MANEIQYRNHTAYNNGTSAENNIKLLDITPFQHEDLSSGVNKLGKMLVAQSFCEPVAVCNSNNPQNGAYVATCSNYPDFALSYQDAQQNTQYLIGLKIRVIFTYGITYGSVSGGTYPTLNINGSGAIPMLAQGKTMATGSASAGQTLEFTVIPYGNGIAFDADSNVRESTSDYTIYADGSVKYNKSAIDTSLLSKLEIKHDRIPYLNVYYTTANMPLTASGETRVNLRACGTDEAYVLLGTRVARPYGSSGEHYFYNIETCGALVFLQDKALIYINSDFESIVGGNQIGIFYGIFKYNS